MYSILKECEDFKDLQFVLKARDEKNFEINYTVLWIVEDDGQKSYMCSDGYRIHFALCDKNIEVGSYAVIQTTKEIVLKKTSHEITVFDYNSVIPNQDKRIYICDTIDLKSKYVDKGEELSRVIAKISLANNEKAINANFLKDVMVGKLKVYLGEKNDRVSIYFEDTTKKAVVTTFRLYK